MPGCGQHRRRTRRWRRKVAAAQAGETPALRRRAAIRLGSGQAQKKKQQGPSHGRCNRGAFGRANATGMRRAQIIVAAAKRRPREERGRQDRRTPKLFGFVLVEPAGYVEHFGDVVRGAACDTVRFFGDAHEHGVNVQ